MALNLQNASINCNLTGLLKNSCSKKLLLSYYLCTNVAELASLDEAWLYVLPDVAVHVVSTNSLQIRSR